MGDAAGMPFGVFGLFGSSFVLLFMSLLK